MFSHNSLFTKMVAVNFSIKTVNSNLFVRYTVSIAMKVLIATPLYPPDDGGPATYTRFIESAFPAQHVDVRVVSFSNFRKYPKLLRHFLYALELFKKSYGVDIIYALDPVSVGLPAALVARIRAKKFVIKIVGDYAWEQGTQRSGVKESLDEFVLRKNYSPLVRVLRTIQTLTATQADHIIVPSKYLQGIIATWGIPQEKISVIYNAFDPHMPTEDRETLRKEFNYQGRVIISVGRLVPWKGFRVMMDAVAKVRQVIPDAHLVIVGSGDQTELRAYARAHNYDFVEFLGTLPHSELMKRIRAADCLGLNTGYEGLSHLLLEAMALEVPIVTTRVGGNTELFETGDRGILVPYNDVDMLYGALLILLEDGKTVTEYAHNARLFVQSFTQERMIKETLALFSTITSNAT